MGRQKGVLQEQRAQLLLNVESGPGVEMGRHGLLGVDSHCTSQGRTT